MIDRKVIRLLPNLYYLIFWTYLNYLSKRKANWIGHILRRNCLLQQVIEGKIKGQIEVTRRRGRRRKKLLDDLQDRRGYCQLKEEALDRTMWRNRFGRGFGHVVWQSTDDEDLNYCLWNSSAQSPTLTLRARRYAAHAQGRCCNNDETFNGGAQYCVNLMVMGLLKSRLVNCLLRIHSNTLRRFLFVSHNEFVSASVV